MTAAPATEHLATLVDNRRRFIAFLEPRVGDLALAEDILQSAFLKTVEKGDTIRRGENVVAWFYRLLRNSLIDHYRHMGAERRALETAANWSSEWEEPDRQTEQAVCRCVLRLLPTLRDDYAIVIRLVDLEGVSVSDFAADQGVTPNNARDRHGRSPGLRPSSGACAPSSPRRPSSSPPSSSA